MMIVLFVAIWMVASEMADNLVEVSSHFCWKDNFDVCSLSNI